MSKAQQQPSDLAEVPLFRVEDLPTEVRVALYNLALSPAPGVPAPGVAREREHASAAAVPGDQLVFYAFNYGSPRAVSFAAGLPALCLERALRRPGWRPKSRSLLRAIMNYREI